jgi:hypothetical protein
MTIPDEALPEIYDGIEEYIAESFSKEETATKDAVRFLLWSMLLGPNEDAIAVQLALPKEVIALYGETARKYGIWTKDGKVAGAEWMDSPLDLLLNAMVLLGLMERKT